MEFWNTPARQHKTASGAASVARRCKVGILVALGTFMLCSILAPSVLADTSTPPQVVSLSYSPSSVDVTDGSAAVTFTAHLTDSSDIQGASIQLQSRTTSGQSVFAPPLSRISGTAQDGIWQTTINLPQGSAAGAWDYAGSVSDAVNHLYFSENSYGTQNLPAAAPGPLTVTDSSPSTPPQVVSLSYSPSSVDVTDGSAAVTFTAHLTDSSDIQGASIQLQSRTTSGQSVFAPPLSRISGTAQDGIWQTTINLPQGSAAGAWDYAGSVSDAVNHLYFSENSYGTQNLPAAAPGPLTVTDAHEPPPSTSGAPSVSGGAVEGQKLSESHGSWTGGPTSYSYQWQSGDGSGNNWSAIPGATGQSYTLTADDVGHTIRVQETATNSGGASSPATSAQTAVVEGMGSGSPSAAPQVVSVGYTPSSVDVTNGSGAVTFTMHLTSGHDITGPYVGVQNEAGTQSMGNSLTLISGTARDGVWQGTVTIPRGASAGKWYYQGGVGDDLSWVSFSSGPGAPQNLPASAPGPLTVTDSSASAAPQVVSVGYTPSSVDVTNGSGAVTFTMHLTSGHDITGPYVGVQNEAGTQSMGNSLTLISGTARDGVWQGTVTIPRGASAGKWYYQGGVGDDLSWVSFSSGPGAPQNLPASAPGPLTVTYGQAPPPSTSGAPSVSGGAVEGQKLSESHGSWTGGPTSYSYQWQSGDGSGNNWSAIPGATGQSYTLTADDVGHTIRVQETATNAGGTSSPAVSTATATVLAAVPSTSGAPSVSGGAVEGQKLSESHGSWTGGPTSYSYQWQSGDGSGNNWSAIPGATGQSYTLTADDVGHTIRVQETATNAGGTSSPAVSTATAVVQAPHSDGGTPGDGGSGTGGTTTGGSGSGATSSGSNGIGASGSSGTGGGTTTSGSGSSATGGSIGGSGRRGSTKAIATFGPIKTSAAGARLSVACRGSSGFSCTLVLRLTVGKGKGATVLGSLSVRLAAGHHKTVTIRLNGSAKQRLNQQHKLTARFTVIQNRMTILQKVITFQGNPSH